jgi:hypothetical protein
MPLYYDTTTTATTTAISRKLQVYADITAACKENETGSITTCCILLSFTNPKRTQWIQTI